MNLRLALACAGVLWADQPPPVLETQALARFARKLSDTSGVVRVYHIGDSHVQGAVFASELRRLFQAGVGDAGRGLAFAHRSVGTNGSGEMVWTGDGPWVASNALRRENCMPWGMAGWSLAGLDSTRGLQLAPRASAPEGMFRSRTAWVLGQGVRMEAVDSCDSLAPTVRRCTFPERDTFRLVLDSFPARFDGLLLENGRDGLVWAEAGVNGLSWNELSRPSRMWEQLNAWAPDLVVVSLGTNDAFAKGYSPESFRAAVTAGVDNIRRAAPGAEVVLVLPPDHALRVRRRRYADNPRILSVESVMRERCGELSVACVELRSLQGGAGAWKEWLARGLLNADHVHYTAAGYREQAGLIHGALMDALKSLPDSLVRAAGSPVDSTALAVRDAFLRGQDSLLSTRTWSEPKIQKPKPPRKPKRFRRFPRFRRPR
ncbi:MAG TPA: GDSL-type esterase/lipase family protein [Fibrobacteria bacterium]|nr:GDSL-type esterase/lipase family protein [Fibrobacteria bacterium]HOX52586.1 GDSL-type esterase/lipase family protein [Fibrobacteria bacterium]